MLAGVAAIGLALTNFPLLVLSIVALALVPVPFLGMALVPWTTKLVRKRTDLERRIAAQSGVLVARPYHPPPERAVPGGWRRFRWVVTDPATWRDLAWLVPGALVGVVLEPKITTLAEPRIQVHRAAEGLEAVVAHHQHEGLLDIDHLHDRRNCIGEFLGLQHRPAGLGVVVRVIDSAALDQKEITRVSLLQ